LAKKFGLKVQILNKDENILEDKEIIIINYFGELQNYFKYTKSVFMGKSTIKRLKDDSGQNPIEAAKLKCKIYYGQYVYNFEEIYQFLEQNKIAARIRDYDELSQNLIKDLRIPNKEKSINSDKIHVLGQKTLIDTINILNIFLKNENI
jgi:3-deoxy-D-manno-octulosonic-acid transferase